jgi:hypothetical protein
MGPIPGHHNRGGPRRARLQDFKQALMATWTLTLTWTVTPI